jgi:hypothetical protein
VTAVCICDGPLRNVTVDGNEGHAPGCPANPHSHPEYLDDDGTEGVQFVRHDLAADEDAVIAWLLREGLYNDEGEIDVVWMCPGEGRGDGEDWYDIAPTEADGVVRYWRLRP